MEGKMGTAQLTLTNTMLGKEFQPLGMVGTDKVQEESEKNKPEPDFSRSSIQVEFPDDVTKGDHFPGRFRLGDPYA
jgi:hypothetical protein